MGLNILDKLPCPEMYYYTEVKRAYLWSTATESSNESCDAAFEKLASVCKKTRKELCQC